MARKQRDDGLDRISIFSNSSFIPKSCYMIACSPFQMPLLLEAFLDFRAEVLNLWAMTSLGLHIRY